MAAVFINAGITLNKQNCLNAGVTTVEQFERLAIEQLADNAEFAKMVFLKSLQKGGRDALLCTRVKLERNTPARMTTQMITSIPIVTSGHRRRHSHSMC